MKAPRVFETLSDTYTVVKVLGEGGSGRVFEVTDGDGLTFALKCMLSDRVSTEKRKRFRNELSFCSTAVHPRILRVLDSGFVVSSDRKCPFYVMPRFESTLRTYIARGIDKPTSLQVLSNLLDGVEAAHLLGVWHRDLKPENILCRENASDLVVADFGVAHFAEEMLETAVETHPNAWLANVAYAAPEQRRKGSAVDQRADIYSLGLILNEIFTGQLAHGKNHALIAERFPELAYLDGIADWLLQQDPEKRPASINAVKSELIGRRNEAIARQRLDEARRVVVREDAPVTFEPIHPVAVTHQDGHLLLTFSRPPPPEWIAIFRAPPENYSFAVGCEPNRFAFDGAVASMRMHSSSAQGVTNNAKQWAAIANRVYPRRMHQTREANARFDREQQERRVREAEEHARLLATLKL